MIEMNLVAWIASGFALAGLAQATASSVLVRRFAHLRDEAATGRLPAVTVLKPLYGDEPGLFESLSTYCAQDYPDFQIVFGVADQNDEAAGVARRVAAAFPARDIAIVVDSRRYGSNGKVSNLINMVAHARHDVLVVADSDMRARPDLLRRIAATLGKPGTGLVTTLYAALPTQPTLTAKLGALQISQVFLPGAVLSRALGRQDCLGATMALTRATLMRIGGFEALKDVLADDNMLGQKIRALGLDVRLAHAVPVTNVTETRMGSLYTHELRWARTLRGIAPVPFALSALQYPLFWGLVALVAAPGIWSLSAFLLLWGWRALAALVVAVTLHPMLGALAFPPALWLLPVRDCLSIAVMIASYASRRVVWRGHKMFADRGAAAASFSPEVLPS
jgi:ceramide glucosyltransferase